MTDQKRLTRDYDKIWREHLKRRDYLKILLDRLETRAPYFQAVNRWARTVRRPRILELGCGTGIDLNTIRRLVGKCTAFGTDISPRSIQVAREVSGLLDNPIDFFVADVNRMPLAESAMDLVFSQGLIEHFGDPLAAVAEQERVVAPRGVLIVNVPQKYTGYTLMKQYRMRRGTWRLGWETAFSAGDLRRIGQRLGLEELGRFGYQYWRSPLEPAFVLRDLVDKIHRRVPPPLKRLLQPLKTVYDRLWRGLESRWGHLFMQNIVIVFRKPAQ